RCVRPRECDPFARPTPSPAGDMLLSSPSCSLTAPLGFRSLPPVARPSKRRPGIALLGLCRRLFFRSRTTHGRPLAFGHARGNTVAALGSVAVARGTRPTAPRSIPHGGQVRHLLARSVADWATRPAARGGPHSGSGEQASPAGPARGSRPGRRTT